MATAAMREIEGLGWEVRLLFRGDLRQSRMFHDFQEAVAWAQDWRQQLESDDWRPPTRDDDGTKEVRSAER